MRDNFERSLHLVLKSEGGYVNLASDPGGPTNLGVTLNTYRQYVDPHGDIEDIKNLTEVQAGAVYRKQYWDKIHGDELPAGVDYAVFDFAVNSGPSRAARALQNVSNVAIDGVIGPHTLSELQKLPAKLVITKLCDRRLDFLQGLPTWTVFRNGWRTRVAAVQAEALKMAAL